VFVILGNVAMADAFDPYYRWLGIPPKDQPANHYRLLAIDRFESNAEVIRDAAEQRMAHVRSYQLGPHSAQSQKILNELASAKACLLNPEKKTAYDKRLREQVRSAGPESNDSSGDMVLDPGLATALKAGQAAAPAQRAARTRPNLAAIVAAAAVAGVVLLGLVIWGVVQMRSSRDLAERKQRGEEPPAHTPTVPSKPTEVATPVAAAEPVEIPTVSGKQPPLAVAPFNEKVAKQHQANWGEYLHVPVVQTNSIGMKLALIPPGEFDMGSTPVEANQYIEEARTIDKNRVYVDWIPAEVPRHRVRITKPFCLGAYEVTQAEYQQIMGSNPSRFSLGGKEGAKVSGRDTQRHPAESVPWEEAERFCRKLSELPQERSAGRRYRLPTEAEWEYACRAGTTTRYYFGDDRASLGEFAWFRTNCSGTTQPVGGKKPNAWGLYDMCGNALEWCLDWHSQTYFAQSAPNDPAGPTSGPCHVERGGMWGSTETGCRSGARHFHVRGELYSGFRVVCDVPGSGG
jgi:formylglycine-generating enzyme required for sulfatase activity